MIDTAAMYQNEEHIGAALKECGKAREEFFVVTKLMNEDHGKEKTEAALATSLKKLGLDYVDLYLIHSPKGKNLLETWTTMLSLRNAGLAKSVGVSNFGVGQLEGLAEAGLELPEVNQIELHPWLQQDPCVEYCRANGIAVMGYCPLARCKTLGKTALVQLAEKHGKTEAQGAIRWAVQSGFITIPKSTNPGRISENSNIFDFAFSDEDMEAIKELNEGFKASGSVNSMDIAWEDVKAA